MGKGIFDGLKVADFTWAAAGPIITKQLSDNGATVIKVESFQHPDSIRLGGPFTGDRPGINRSGFFADFHSSKLGIAVNLGHARRAEIIHRLVEWADVVADSFRPGVMAQWGFDYERLKTLNPRIISLSSSLYGADGPWARHPGYGAQGQALAGIHAMTGWPDRDPAMPKGAYSDSVSPRFGMAALAAALIHREKTGEGQRIELSQIETTVKLLTPELLYRQISGREPSRSGNYKEGVIVHGVYPCQGDERWIVIEAGTQAQWDGLCDVLGDRATLEAVRHTYGPVGQDGTFCALDIEMAKHTESWDAFELMARLRQAGVPAGVALKSCDLLEDDVLEQRQHFWPLDHAEMGTLKYNGPAYRFSRTPSELRSAAPLLGEHTEEVLTGILGFTPEDIDGFRACKLLD